MTKQILAWLVIIAAFTAVGLLVDYWRIRRAHPEIFRRTPGGHGDIGDIEGIKVDTGLDPITGYPKYWGKTGSLDVRNPFNPHRSRWTEIEPPHWTSLD